MGCNYFLAWLLGFLSCLFPIFIFLLTRFFVRERRKSRELDGIWTGRGGG